MFFSPRRKPGWLAILPQGETLTLAHVVRPARPSSSSSSSSLNSPPQLRLLDSFAIDRDAADALARLRGARALKGYRCTTLLGEGDYNVTPLEPPAVPRAERREALRWSLKEMVNYPVDSACLDLLDLPNAGLTAGRSAGVLVVSAPEAAVRACVEPFVVAKIALEVVDIPDLAQRNVAALLEDDNRGLAFLRIDERGMMLTLTFHGELVAVRRGDMNTLQLTGGSEEMRARVRERLVLELQRSLDNFDRQYSHIPISKVVVACYPQVDDLLAALAESSYVPVREMDLAPVIDFSLQPALNSPQQQARHLLAIGAALRSEEAPA